MEGVFYETKRNGDRRISINYIRNFLPFAELGKGIMNSVGLSWGWGVMIIGSCILLYAAFKLYNGEDE